MNNKVAIIKVKNSEILKFLNTSYNDKILCDYYPYLNVFIKNLYFITNRKKDNFENLKANLVYLKK